MSSYSTKYRKEHPDCYEKERFNDRERVEIVCLSKSETTSYSKILQLEDKILGLIKTNYRKGTNRYGIGRWYPKGS